MATLKWIIGVSLSITANIISNTGLNVQKKAHSKRAQRAVNNLKPEMVDEKKAKKTHSDNINGTNHRRALSSQLSLEAIENSEEGSYCCDSVWLSGLLLQVIGALCDFGALGFAPQSVVAPLGSLTLVVNVFLSKIMHSESPSKKTIFATFLIITGAVVTVAFSAKGSDLKSVKDVLKLYTSWPFLIYGVVVVAYLSILYLSIRFMIKISKKKPELYKRKYYKLHRFAIASLAGTTGAQNILFANGVSTLLVLTVQGNGFMFTQPLTYALIFGLGFSMTMQLRWLNAGLKRFSALHIVPVFQSFWILVSVVGGLFVYKELTNLSGLSIFIFPVGIITVISGVSYLTTQGQPQKLKESDEVRKRRIINKTFNANKRVEMTQTLSNNIYNLNKLKSLTQNSSRNSESNSTNSSNTGVPFNIQSRHRHSRSEPNLPSRSPSENRAIIKRVLPNHLLRNLDLVLPSPQEFVAKFYQATDASIVLGSGLGRLVVRSDMLSDIEFGVTEDDKNFFLDNENINTINTNSNNIDSNNNIQNNVELERVITDTINSNNSINNISINNNSINININDNNSNNNSSEDIIEPIPN